MATDVTMPRLSDSMEEGTIIKWLVSEGDEVKRGQEIAEIETDKANMTYEADTDGVLIEIVAGEGDTLAIGEVIARIGDEGEEPSGGGEKDDAEAKGEEEDDSEEEAADDEEDGGDEAGDGEPEAEGEADEADGDAEEGEEEEAEEAEREEAPAAESDDGAEAEADGEKEQKGAKGSEDGAGDGRVKASPVAKRMASEMGVELAELEGSGPGGRIVKADVEAAAKGDGKAREQKAEEKDGKPSEDGKGEKVEKPAKPQPAGEAGPKGEVQVQELTKLQQTVSRRMAESKATAPDFQLNVDVDMTLCVELRERLKQVSDPPPSVNDMVVKASANALHEFPRVNAAYRDGKFELYERVNVGVAVAARETLIVPTVFDAERKSLGEIARQTRELVKKVRDGKITPPELSGGTFTVSNLGMYGIDSFSAVINPPQAAILTVGALKKKPVVDEDSGRVVPRDMMSLTLTCDHRILYGADGAEFLARVREILEQPLALAL